MLCRPREQFASFTGYKSSEKLHFLLSPSDPDLDESAGRGERTKQTRDKMKKARTPKQLLERFIQALQDDMADSSVVGAAVQRCGHGGYGGWWEALLQVWELQQRSGVELHSMQKNLFIDALASCVKCYQGKGSRRRRKVPALKLAKEAWDYDLPASPRDFNCRLSSALKVCLHVGNEEAFQWADDIWSLVLK